MNLPNCFETLGWPQVWSLKNLFLADLLYMFFLLSQAMYHIIYVSAVYPLFCHLECSFSKILLLHTMNTVFNL
jgi:hypothetical protein